MFFFYFCVYSDLIYRLYKILILLGYLIMGKYILRLVLIISLSNAASLWIPKMSLKIPQIDQLSPSNLTSIAPSWAAYNDHYTVAVLIVTGYGPTLTAPP